MPNVSRALIKACVVVGLGLGSVNVSAVEVIAAAGGSAQPGANQHNRLASVDVLAWDWQRSQVQRLSIGGSITRLQTDSGLEAKHMTAISLFPELKLFTEVLGKPAFMQVRALGPTWLSQPQLGERHQAYRFAFQAQLGFGAYFGEHNRGIVQVFYRHYSNANLRQPNDGIDVLLNLGLGYRF
ncbi:acyloxyacyl hydrolase [Paraferrimonas sedimenticola]|uniref:Uncharacterized protein n=1 Tax=Paraferrimonas sedimenticola TaxID=375674 RepID=A0AA37RXA0_9GAMM|nr:acyloxyacyl hydrolase [Paraferrimonas sedimenticola]GLP97023.1 hypothetical protein GCM10007895_23290 [Paraferrimonas sedimenticola]